MRVHIFRGHTAPRTMMFRRHRLGRTQSIVFLPFTVGLRIVH